MYSRLHSPYLFFQSAGDNRRTDVSLSYREFPVPGAARG